MTRTTRSRQALASALTKKIDIKTDTTKENKSNTVQKSKKNINKSKLEVKKSTKQNENVLKNKKPVKNTGSKVSESINKNNSPSKSLMLEMKSPVLRDRTNINNELVKDNSTKNDVETNENNLIEKCSIKQTKKLPTRKLKISLDKCVFEELEKDENLTKNKDVNKNERKKINERTEKSNHRDIENPITLKSKPDSQIKDLPIENSSLNKKRSLRRKNISIEAVEKLLNEDDEFEKLPIKELSEDEEILNKENDGEFKISDENLDSCNNNKNIKSQKTIRKFFTHNNNKQISTQVKKNFHKKTKANKKRDDSTLDFEIEGIRESVKLPEKNLRLKANINYCELSKLSHTSSPEEKSGKEEPLPYIENDHKGIPIYKTVRLSQENVKNKEEIYDFPDDSKENNRAGNKKKKTKKPAIRRVKKTATSRPFKAKGIKKKSTKKISNNVQFKPQDKITIEKKDASGNIVVKNIPIPEYLVNAGDSTVEEASTIKIKSIQSLEGSKKINLTSTPPAPKTISSKLKLFGPKNVITDQTSVRYSNMINHSLIRKSMSPITKITDNFDAGSPWRAVDDTFCRVQKMVQSTPQINRLPSMRDKKPPLIQTNFNKKSIHSQDTIHLSSVENKSSNTEQNAESNSSKKDNSSTRKFGTEILDLSSLKSRSKSGSSSKSSSQNIQLSIVQPISFKSDFKDLKDQEDIPMIAAFDNKENISPRAHRSPKKKYSIPCPFRFEKIHSTKPASNNLKSDSPKSSLQKDDIELENGAGPSCVNEPKPTVLKQTNLNKFLNIDEMPESTSIITAHGIFDDICSIPTKKIKPKKLIDQLNVKNAFGFDDSDIEEEEPLPLKKSSTPIIATKKDVEKSVKGKIFPNARVKSAIPSRISENTVKNTLLRDVLKKKKANKKISVNNENDSKEENQIKTVKQSNNDNYVTSESKSVKDVVLDSISFADTFDVVSENKEELLSKVPDEVPLFVDLEPAHFSQPPRRSYCKRKRAVSFNYDNEVDSETDDDDSNDGKKRYKKSKPKKKESKLNKEEQKRMQQWVKSVNETFEEIDHFDLLVE